MHLYNIKVKETVVDHTKYLGNLQNSSQIYDKTADSKLVLPFNATSDIMKRLLLVDFKGDTVYSCIELQVIPSQNEEKQIVILYRRDGSKEYYYTDEDWMNTRKQSIIDLINEVTFCRKQKIDMTFESDQNGLRASLELVTNKGQHISFKVKENLKNRKLTAMLAPIGDESQNPQFFPFVYLKDFAMVVQKGTQISITVDDEKMVPDEMPVKMNGNVIYLTRYCLDPVIFNWNNSFQGKLNPIEPFDKTVTHDNSEYTISYNDSIPEIRSFNAKNKLGHKLTVEFSPPIPNLRALLNEQEIEGKFSVVIDDKKGVVAGKYKVATSKDNATMEIVPTKGWQPFPGKVWVETYRWEAKISNRHSETVSVETSWRREK